MFNLEHATISVDNLEDTISFYKKFGFEEKAIRPGYYNGIDGILMERKRTLN